MKLKTDGEVMAMILEISELSKQFVKKSNIIHAVDKVSFQIKTGEFASIIGPSGSGKSTLFHLVTGLLKPTSGKIVMDGFRIDDTGVKKLEQFRNETVGYILQEQNLLKNFTVLENICMPYLIGRSRKQNVIEKAEKLLETVGIVHLKNAFPNEISGGEGRRVAIARALINEPSLLIADEPTSNLDSENSAAIMKLFKAISNTQAAVLISTHDTKFLEYSDKVFLMNNGRLESK